MTDEKPKSASDEIDEAADALKELASDLQLPFGRWLIKLLIEKALVPAIVPAITGASAAAVGWYTFGKPEATQEIKREAREEVERLETARELVDRHVRPGAGAAAVGTSEVMRRVEAEWRERFPAPADEAPDPAQQAQFPREFVQERLNTKQRTE